MHGRLETSMASSVVLSPQWDRSISIPSSLHRLTNLDSEMAQGSVVSVPVAAAHLIPGVVSQLQNP